MHWHSDEHIPAIVQHDERYCTILHAWHDKKKKKHVREHFTRHEASRYGYDHVNHVPEQKEKQKRTKHKGKKTEKGKQRQSNERN